MGKRKFGALAVDLGASSGRFAAGWIEEGRIVYEVIEQIPHQAIAREGRLQWDLTKLLNLCRSAASYGAANFESSTLGIDAWGVDHGFVDHEGNLVSQPICYRDLSHVAAFDNLEPYRIELYALTGIQHQPFNTICQLVARKQEDPSLPSRASFLFLPDLLGYLLTGRRNYELTEASTSQLLGLDRNWSERAFEICGWPVPEMEPQLPGKIAGEILPTVRLASIGSHDTASALLGFGLDVDTTYAVNVGTWSLGMFPREEPLATPEAASENFTNERMVDGRVRFLKNIPGFYIVNRLHEELAIGGSVAAWLSSAALSSQTIDLFDDAFFNPDSMVHACLNQLDQAPESEAEWAGIIIKSLARAIAEQPNIAEKIGIAPISGIRIGGGGSQSAKLCQEIADQSGKRVSAGPVEATVLGNLALQFLASGVFENFEQMNASIRASFDSVEYLPT